MNNILIERNLNKTISGMIYGIITSMIIYFLRDSEFTDITIFAIFVIVLIYSWVLIWAKKTPYSILSSSLIVINKNLISFQKDIDPKEISNVKITESNLITIKQNTGREIYISLNDVKKTQRTQVLNYFEKLSLSK